MIIFNHILIPKKSFFKNIGVNTEYCLDMNGLEEFNCICNPGFEGRRCEISLCGGVACENGFCDNGNCICESGYIKIESVCVETCALSPCQELK